MTSYILRRLLLVIPTLIGLTAVVFFVMAFSPGKTGAALLSAEGGLKSRERKAMEEYLNARYGLDKPRGVQYLRWLRQVSPIGPKNVGEGWPSNSSIGLKKPDLGHSFTKGRPVADLILEA